MPDDRYVGKIDEEVRKHIERHWHGKNEVKVMPLMKTLTFNIICSLIFAMKQEARRDALRGLFQNMIEGMLIHNKDNSALLSDEEIEDNAVIIMIAGYDTSSILLTFLIRLLANEPSIYAAIVQEKEEIAKSKTLGELLTWDDLSKMQYTWRVAMETLRITPPGFCSFRRVLKDTEFGGCPIPKGWQVVWAASMTHMDKTIFPNPSKIDSTRFEQQAPATYCFVAFGRPRMCPGYEFAKIETLALLGDPVHIEVCGANSFMITTSLTMSSIPVRSQGSRGQRPLAGPGQRHGGVEGQRP
ncbi:hypothetical protein ACSBR2_026230 [Camellia fascicularis]